MESNSFTTDGSSLSKNLDSKASYYDRVRELGENDLLYSSFWEDDLEYAAIKAFFTTGMAPLYNNSVQKLWMLWIWTITKLRL